MGGRRAASVSQVLGHGRSFPLLERDLRSAIESQDAEAIAQKSVELSRKVVPSRTLDSYLEHFTPFIQDKLARGKALDEPRREVRAEWSRLKREHDIRVSPVLGDAVVQAVIDFLKTRL